MVELVEVEEVERGRASRSFSIETAGGGFEEEGVDEGSDRVREGTAVVDDEPACDSAGSSEVEVEGGGGGAGVDLLIIRLMTAPS